MTRRRGWRDRCWRACLILSILAVVLTACGASDSAPETENLILPGAKPAGKLLFAQNGDISVWDGSVKRITQVGDASAPRWSGDGSRFVFVRTGYSTSDIYVANADGGDMQQLTSDEPLLTPGTEDYAKASVWALDPAWSRSGESIVFASDRGTAKNYLWIIHGIGNDATQVKASTVNGENVEHPDFSPDGSQVVFDQRTGANESFTERWTQIWKTDVGTNELTPLVQGDKASYYPAFSPDGSWVAFVQRNGKANDLWVVPSGGGEPTQLTTTGVVTAPAWSPDGKHIAFFQVDGQSFKTSYVEFSVGSDGAPKASKPQDLFSADGADAPSGLSWAP